MNPRKFSFMLMTISFVFIMAGAVSTFVIGLQQDQREFYKKIDNVNNGFEVFSTNTSIFGTTRDELYNVVFADVYYDTMYQEDKKIKDKLSNYEQLVDELTNNVKYLDEVCEDPYNIEESLRDKCINYKSIYEQVVNYFVSDIQNYNSSVLKYNEYQTSINSSYQINSYLTKKEFIDYNNDSVYEGKEE